MPALHHITSADSVKPTGAETPADALEVIQRMSTSNDERQESYECPNCDRQFDTVRGMKIHHAEIHGESIAGKECTCEWCGETFRRCPAKVAENDSTYCSQSCVHESRTVEWAGDGHPNANSITVTCDECGEQFRRNPSREARNDRTFCSWDCYSEHMFDPETDGINYGSNWRTQRQRVLERDGEKCVVCSSDTSEHILDVHHIQPIRSFKTPEDANTLDNLITLCRPCHHEWEGVPLRPEVV
jgi:5-methylcytosine-specific restriction endonuclease McrA